MSFWYWSKIEASGAKSQVGVLRHILPKLIIVVCYIAELETKKLLEANWNLVVDLCIKLIYIFFSLSEFCEDSHKFKKSAIVEFENTECVLLALGLNGQKLKGNFTIIQPIMRRQQLDSCNR